MAVPNQKRVKIHKSDEKPFLQVPDAHWLEAQRKMSMSAFVLYLYLADNMDGFSLELSFEAFKNKTGYSKASYHRAVDELLKLKYLYYGPCGLEFATSPINENPYEIHNWELEDSELKSTSSKKETAVSQICNEKHPKVNTEINNKEEYIVTDIDRKRFGGYSDYAIKEFLKMGF